MLRSLSEIKNAARDGASPYWFDKNTVEFFSSRVSSNVYPVDGGAYFVTSEQDDSASTWHPRLYTVRHCTDDGVVTTIGEFQQYDSLSAAHAAARIAANGNPDGYRWIIYMHDPLGGFEVDRVTSLESAKSALVAYCNNTGFYANLQVNGDYGCTASLYPYSSDAWESAESFRNSGCPFDYPTYLVTRGPRGGVIIERA